MRRIGKFNISAHLVSNYHPDAMRVMGMCTIMRAEFIGWTDEVEYVAICDKFRLLPMGERPPTYQITFEDEHPIFTEVKS